MRRRQESHSLTAIVLFTGILFGLLAGSFFSRPAGKDTMPPGQKSPSVQQQESNPGGCPDTEIMSGGYLGIHGGRIAIFSGSPPGGELLQVTEYEVRSDTRDQLEQGIPFQNAEELLRLLENFTS